MASQHLLNIDRDLMQCILFDWVDPVDVSAFDIALCNRLLRAEFLTFLQNSSSQLCGVTQLLSILPDNPAFSKLEWLMERKIRSEQVAVTAPVVIPDLVAQSEIFAQSAFYVKFFRTSITADALKDLTKLKTMINLQIDYGSTVQIQVEMLEKHVLDIIKCSMLKSLEITAVGAIDGIFISMLANRLPRLERLVIRNLQSLNFQAILLPAVFPPTMREILVRKGFLYRHLLPLDVAGLCQTVANALKGQPPWLSIRSLSLPLRCFVSAVVRCPKVLHGEIFIEQDEVDDMITLMALLEALSSHRFPALLEGHDEDFFTPSQLRTLCIDARSQENAYDPLLLVNILQTLNLNSLLTRCCQLTKLKILLPGCGKSVGIPNHAQLPLGNATNFVLIPQTMHFLTELTIRGRVNLKHSFFEKISSGCPLLTKLALEQVTVSEEGRGLLLLQHCRSLTSLELKCLYGQDSGQAIGALLFSTPFSAPFFAQLKSLALAFECVVFARNIAWPTFDTSTFENDGLHSPAPDFLSITFDVTEPDLELLNRGGILLTTLLTLLSSVSKQLIQLDVVGMSSFLLCWRHVLQMINALKALPLGGRVRHLTLPYWKDLTVSQLISLLTDLRFLSKFIVVCCPPGSETYGPLLVEAIKLARQRNGGFKTLPSFEA